MRATTSGRASGTQGVGMSTELQGKIFDPLYTTKERCSRDRPRPVHVQRERQAGPAHLPLTDVVMPRRRGGSARKLGGCGSRRAVLLAGGDPPAVETGTPPGQPHEGQCRGFQTCGGLQSAAARPASRLRSQSRECPYPSAGLLGASLGVSEYNSRTPSKSYTATAFLKANTAEWRS